MLRQRPVYYFYFTSSLILYLVVGYGIDRHKTLPLFAAYFALFILFTLVVRKTTTASDQQLTFWITASVIFRALLLFSVPALSDDFYRFIWDGRLLAGGHHPFSEVPAYYIRHPDNIPGIDSELFHKLNAKETYTSYPSFAQLIFWISVKLSAGSIYGSMVVMKFIIFLFELATLWIMPRLFRDFNVRRANILLYSLNPLVILELTGNLHFEGIMIFFLLLAIHALTRQQFLVSSALYALSICTKLIPILFLPLFVRHLGWKKATTYWISTGVMVVLLFLPLLNMDIVRGLSTSLGYYFQRFEFNASVYYIVRAFGYLIFGFNIIQFAGPLLALAATMIILRISFRNLPSQFAGQIDKNLFDGMLWCLLVYFLSTAILHPWYIITLLAISLFTPYRFPVVWTGAIFLTYAGYTGNGFRENLFLVALEYIVVIAYVLYETVWTNRKSHS